MTTALLEPTTPRISNRCSNQFDAAMIVAALKHADGVIDRLEIARIDNAGSIVVVWESADACQDELRLFIESLEGDAGGMALPLVPFSSLAMLRTFNRITCLEDVRVSLEAVDAAIGHALRVLPGAASFRVQVRRIRQSIAAYLASLPA